MLTPPSTPARLDTLYGVAAPAAQSAIESAIADVAERLASQKPEPTPRWTEQDTVLITYADILRGKGGDDRSPLAVLKDWLVGHGYGDLLSTVHLLPFCPYSSDDGFSVIDYLAVDPESGTWEDIRTLGDPFDLMFDLVLNHISDQSEWFHAYVRGEAPMDRFFIEVDAHADLSAVTRPRPGPPWKEVETAHGLKRVWSTFSDGATKDQMDLNYGEPRLLAEMLRILLEYAERGARIIRLDAIAYLWKELGTSCIHLPQTHEVVKLCRDLLALHSPRTLVLTETNVPHAENVSYFGDTDPQTGEGDEAHLIYNFSLPPLLVEAFVSGDATAIRSWLADLAPPPPGCTFFNFTASHDGIGVRPLEGLVSQERFDRLIEAMRTRGARVNMKRNPDGSESPYEINITYVDALAPGEHNSPPRQGEPASLKNGGEGVAPDTNDPSEANAPNQTAQHAKRFLATQAVALALRGMPAVYFHSLVGTQNDNAAVEATGQNRRINRHKYSEPELEAHLATEGTLARQIADGYRHLLRARRQQPAFHPDAPQELVDLGDDRVLAFKRTSLDGKQTILVAVNFSDEGVELATNSCDDLITGSVLRDRRLRAESVAWLM
ncbi:MAG: alpha-amylase family glycosyl hydrolase [Planctomycetota bacterium]